MRVGIRPDNALKESSNDEQQLRKKAGSQEGVAEGLIAYACQAACQPGAAFFDLCARRPGDNFARRTMQAQH